MIYDEFYKDTNTLKRIHNIELNTYSPKKVLKIIQVFKETYNHTYYNKNYNHFNHSCILGTYSLVIIILYFRLKSSLKQRKKFQNGLRY